MEKIPGITWVLLALSLVIGGILAPATGRGTPADPFDKLRAGRQGPIRPFFDARESQTSYAGPGREKAPPADVKEVRIGYFGPSTDSHPEGGDMWCAACLAVDEANHRSTQKNLKFELPDSKLAQSRRLPFRLVAGWSDNPWGSGVTQVTRMVYVDSVWAIIGGIDGPSTHLAEQVVTKARLTLVSPASTDRTANLANVPWMFSCLPPDNVQAPVLARAIESCVGDRRFVLVSAVDHDSHICAVQLLKSLARHQLAPVYHFEFDARQGDFAELADEILDTKAHALVVVAGARPSADIIRTVRKRGFGEPIFGGPCMGRRTFLEKASKAAEGVVFPLLYRPGKRASSFEQKFIARFGKRPDYLAAHTYDAVNLLIEAIDRAGLNRARIGDAVRELSPWHGVTADIRWDSLGSNSRPVGLGTIKNGRVLPVSHK